MKKSIFLLCIVMVICFLNCDGRNRTHRTNAQVLSENNLLESFKEQINFVPEAPVEIITDTIMSNGFQIKLSYNSIENSSVLKTKSNNSTETYYKNFEAKLHVLKNGLTINQTVINKKLFFKFEDQSFLETAIMQYVWIDYESSTKEELVFNTAFHIPDTDTYKDYILKVDALGVIQIKEKNHSPNII